MGEPPFKNPAPAGGSWLNSSPLVKACLAEILDECDSDGCRVELSVDAIRLTHPRLVGEAYVERDAFLADPKRVTASLLRTIRELITDSGEGEDDETARVSRPMPAALAAWFAAGGDFAAVNGPASPYSRDWIGSRSG